jgi:CRISPR-associated endoribonuclease Cas6
LITHLEIALSETDLELNTNMSSVMHGAIMEIVSGEFAEEMHKQAIRPYSQSVYKIADNKWIWSINTLNDYAAKNIINAITNNNLIYIKNRESELNISNYSVYKTSFDDLFTDNYLGEKRSRYLTMEFITPTAFKSNEKYVFMPDIALIMKSIISKYDTLSTTTDIMDDNLLDKIVEDVSIAEYRIRSRYFYLEKTRIPGFVGRLKLKINGSQNMVNMIHMLVDFAQYSGIGIKTALGMGVVKKL